MLNDINVQFHFDLYDFAFRTLYLITELCEMNNILDFEAAKGCEFVTNIFFKMLVLKI